MKQLLKKENAKETKCWLYYTKCLLLGVLICIVLLLFISAGVYFLDFTEKITKGLFMAVYFLGAFATGYGVAGRAQKKKFLHGILGGIAFFFLLLIISFLFRQGDKASGARIFSAFLLCAAGGMLGGMLK